MAFTKRSWQDHLSLSFGQAGEVPRTTEKDILLIGGVEDGGTTVQYLPIGTAAGGTAVKVDLIGTEPVVVQVGTITVGTITQIGTVVGQGTLAAVGIIHNAGTLQAGTLQLNPKPTRNILTYGTTLSGTAATYATMVGSQGVGTAIWVSDLSIINDGTAVLQTMAGFGTALNGAQVLAKGLFAANGGVEKSFDKAVNAATSNLDLVGYIGGAGTATFCVSYWIE